MQQFLLPTSGGAPQIINIPVSLLSQTNQQPISFITANGQIFQLPNFSQLVVQQNGEGGNSSGTNNSTSSTTTLTNASNGNTNTAALTTVQTSTAGSGGGGTATNNTGQQQQQQQALVINHQGQLISLPVLQATQQPVNTIITNATNFSGQQTVNLSQINLANNTTAGGAKTALTTGTTPIKTLLVDDEKSENDDHGPTIANIQLSNSVHTQGITTVNGVLPTTHHATTVDGVNLDEIREFAKAFKLRRLALGLTQTQVGQALSATKGPAYSQSAICRFEKLDITPKSAAKIKPVLEKWMQEAELKYADRLKSGSQQNFADLLGSETSKKRKRRTSFTPQALEVLNDAFEKNTHPSGNQGADITMLANKLNIDREVIRVWFCNKRQALKNTVKKSRPDDGMDSSMSPSSPAVACKTIVTLSSPPHPPAAQPTIITLSSNGTSSSTDAGTGGQLVTLASTAPAAADETHIEANQTNGQETVVKSESESKSESKNEAETNGI